MDRMGAADSICDGRDRDLFNAIVFGVLRWRGRLMETGSVGKTLLGVLLIAVGLLVATNLDKRLETVLVDASPAWLTELTTKF